MNFITLGSSGSVGSSLRKMISVPAGKPAAAKPAAAKPALADVNKHGVRWNPDYHATVSQGGGKLNADGHWAARRGISDELKALVKVPESKLEPVPAEPEATTATNPEGEGEDATGSGGFNSELEGTLKDFGF